MYNIKSDFALWLFYDTLLTTTTSNNKVISLDFSKNKSVARAAVKEINTISRIGSCTCVVLCGMHKV